MMSNSYNRLVDVTLINRSTKPIVKGKFFVKFTNIEIYSDIVARELWLEEDKYESTPFLLEKRIGNRLTKVEVRLEIGEETIETLYDLRGCSYVPKERFIFTLNSDRKIVCKDLEYLLLCSELHYKPDTFILKVIHR